MSASTDSIGRTRERLRGVLFAVTFLSCLIVLSSYLIQGMFALMAQAMYGTHIAVLLAFTAVIAMALAIAVLALAATTLSRRRPHD